MKMQSQTFIKTYVPKEFEKQFLIKKAPDITVNDTVYIENGIVCVDVSHTSGVVYDDKGILCESSITYRFDGCMAIPSFNDKCDFIDEQVIFMGCGYIFNHFGHFLLEGLSRLYPMLDKKYKNKKLVFVVNKNTKKLPSYVLDILGGLGVKQENIILIHKTTRFAGVYVPPQASVITKYISNIMNTVLDAVAKNLENKNLKTYKKIYLSRSKMNDGRTFGESVIEKIFANNGYQIVWPETLSLQDQITLVKNSEIIAGIAGTALHLSLFMKPGGTVIQIKRNTLNSDNAEIQNDICNFKNLNFVYIAGSIEKRPTKHFTDVPQLVGITKFMKQFFDENKFKYTSQDVVCDKYILRQYKKQLCKYKIKRTYTKFISVIARIISLFGITKYGRQNIRKSIMNFLHV